MPEHRTEAEPSNFNLSNILFAIFKWKRTILGFAILGILAAATAYFFFPPVYESDARLLVRYVLERSGYDSVDAVSGQGGRSGSGISYDGVIAAEVSILTSWDLSVQVVEALGPNRVLPDSKAPTLVQAAGTINSGLTTATAKGSNIIAVSYQNRRPEVATAVLNELVNRYFTKHLEVHRSAGAFDFVSQQTDQVRGRLGQTEDALKQLKAKAGIFDLKDSISALNAEGTKTAEQLSIAEGDLAEQRAKVKLMEGSAGLPAPAVAQPAPKSTPGASAVPGQPTPSATSAATPGSATPSAKDTQEYQAVATRLGQVRQTELELLSKYTDASSQVKFMRSQIADLENQKSALEKKFPSLVIIGASQGHEDLGTERARLAGMEAKADTLRHQLVNIQERMKQLSNAAPEITRLERTKELEETNYKYFQGTLEKARVDEALDPSKMPNISAVQRPSPPALVTKTRDKVALGLAGGGLALGIAISLLSELVLNRTVKRRSQLELQLHTPVMLSIPHQNNNARRLLWRNGHRAAARQSDSNKPDLAPWDTNHFIRPYSAAIRDRLGLYFELHGVAHKPKLVGVAGFGEGAGASTLAAGIAAALSETGDGKVLLVDVNATNGQAHPFFAGQPAASLTAAIEPQAPIASTTDNLYLATVAKPDGNSRQIALKKFLSLVPNLKGSDFDYIIFDMPPLSQTSPTVGLAALMDKVLLVVEAEKSSREAVKRGYRELVAARADVAVILNKTRSHGLNWLEGEN